MCGATEARRLDYRLTPANAIESMMILDFLSVGHQNAQRCVGEVPKGMARLGFAAVPI
jgi:hypothetical protein